MQISTADCDARRKTCKACDKWEGTDMDVVVRCFTTAGCAHVQRYTFVKADLRLVVNQISSASGFGALQPEPPAQPALPAVVSVVHQPKQSLSQPQPQPHQPHQPPCHLLQQLPHPLPGVLIPGTFVVVQSGPLSGVLQKQLHVQKQCTDLTV